MVMDSEHIEQLLERYWKCETSLEEEAQLRAYFTEEGNIPAHLLRYKDLFVYQQLQHDARLSDDFDERILAQVEAPVVKARRMSLMSRFVPLFKPAVVAVVLSLGNVMQHSFYAENGEMATADTIGKQISAPSVALSEEASATHEQQILDSLQRVEKQELKK